MSLEVYLPLQFSGRVCHQEGRRGSDEVGPEPSVLPSRETGVWGTFGGCMKGVRYHFALQDRTWVGNLLYKASEKGRIGVAGCSGEQE